MPAIGTSDMPPASADLATAWPFLEEGIEDVMARYVCPLDTVSRSAYMCRHLLLCLDLTLA